MTRKCSHCSNNGHNSRTCPNRGVKIFGVRLTDGSIRKSASMGNLTLHTGLSNSNHGGCSNHLGSPGGDNTPDHDPAADGYASEDFVKGSSSSCRERKKGVPWTEEEHRMFLLGLQKLGKGDWRGISRNYVISRTPTQVASHAQKYFIRQTNMSRRKRRSSLFDLIADESAEAPQVVSAVPISHHQAENQSNNQLPVPAADEKHESMDSINSNGKEPLLLPNPVCNPVGLESSYPVLVPAYLPYYPFSFPFWPGYTATTMAKETHEVVKPVALHTKSPMNVDELVGKLSIEESLEQMPLPPSYLSLKMPESSTRQSAFQANNTVTATSSVNSSSSPIHAL